MASREGTGTPVIDLVVNELINGNQPYCEASLLVERAFVALGFGTTILADLLRARDAAGRATYGHPLRHDTRKTDGSRYNWRQEAAEELADALLYLRAAIEEEKGHD